MAGKVFHVGDAVHQRVKSFCATHKIRPKIWVEIVVLQALAVIAIDPHEFVFAPRDKAESGDKKLIASLQAEIEQLVDALDEERKKKVQILGVVEKKPGRTLSDSNGDDPAYVQPPFWESREPQAP